MGSNNFAKLFLNLFKFNISAVADELNEQVL